MTNMKRWNDEIMRYLMIKQVILAKNDLDD